MKAKTISSEQVWQAPDGQKAIWNVTIEADGKQYPLRTFSPKISQAGWEGDVETYVSARGERFVKQTPRSNGFGGGGQPRDDAAIRAQFSIKAAVAALPQAAVTGDNREYLGAVEELALEIYAMVDRVKGSQS